MRSVNNDVFQKFKKASKISQREEIDGNEVKFDVREDEEQSVKLQEIIDLLVAAGYFRARIKGLSSFDKVVGGMTWCIESCNVDVDVDLLFQENSTIGQKIALTEKIVAVLPQLKCPHRIEPHQIQGLDFIHIFPVIQWLVKRSMEFREEHASLVRSYAVNQFHKQFSVDEKYGEVERKVFKNVNEVQELYQPHRFYKRKNEPPPDLQSRVQVTLLEYGLRGDINRKRITSDESSSSFSEDEQAHVEINKIEQFLNNMTITNEDFGGTALNDEDEKLLKTHYELLQYEIGGDKEAKGKYEIATLKRQKELLDEKITVLKAKKEDLEKQVIENTRIVEMSKQKLQEASATLHKLENTEVDSDNLKEVEELVMLSGNLRNQEIEFRDYCKQELTKLQSLIQEAKTPSKVPESRSDQGVKEELEKMKNLRLQLAKKNRNTAGLQRQLDEVPNRAEMAQYQRRFLELYNQVAMKHKETKQYYTLFNTLEDTRQYMKKELSLLNSISESYLEVLVTPSAKEEFITQFESILESVKQSKRKVESKLKEEKVRRDNLSQTLQSLVEQQRRYVAAVRQLSTDCKKHESLLAQYQKRSS